LLGLLGHEYSLLLCFALAHFDDVLHFKHHFFYNIVVALFLSVDLVQSALFAGVLRALNLEKVGGFTAPVAGQIDLRH